VLGLDLAGARLMVLWLLEERAEILAPPLTDMQVDAILARMREGVTEPPRWPLEAHQSGRKCGIKRGIRARRLKLSLFIEEAYR